MSEVKTLKSLDEVLVGEYRVEDRFIVNDVKLHDFVEDSVTINILENTIDAYDEAGQKFFAEEKPLEVICDVLNGKKKEGIFSAVLVENDSEFSAKVDGIVTTKMYLSYKDFAHDIIKNGYNISDEDFDKMIKEYSLKVAKAFTDNVNPEDYNSHG